MSNCLISYFQKLSNNLLLMSNLCQITKIRLHARKKQSLLVVSVKIGVALVQISLVCFTSLAHLMGLALSKSLMILPVSQSCSLTFSCSHTLFTAVGRVKVGCMDLSCGWRRHTVHRGTKKQREKDMLGRRGGKRKGQYSNFTRSWHDQGAFHFFKKQNWSFAILNL